MLGTGEFASSASESTSPSWISNSCTVGTYCSQIGSPGDLMRSTIAGEMRNSKFSAACRRRAMSPTCSAPKRAANASSEAMPFLRSSSCQVSSSQILGIDHQVVTGRVVPRDGRGPGVAACFVKPARRCVIGARAGLDDYEPPAVSRQPALDLTEQLRSDSTALASPIYDNPIQIARRLCPWGRAPARVPNQLIALERADKLIVVISGQTVVEQLDRGGDLLLAEEARATRQLLKPCAVRAPDGAQRAAHARPSFPGPLAARSRRCGGSAPSSPIPRPSPCATGPPRRSDRDWDLLPGSMGDRRRRPAGRHGRIPFLA